MTAGTKKRLGHKEKVVSTLFCGKDHRERLLPNIHWGMPQPWFSVWENNHHISSYHYFWELKKVFFRDCNCEPVGMGRTQNLHPDGRTFTLTHPFFDSGPHYWVPFHHPKNNPLLPSADQPPHRGHMVGQKPSPFLQSPGCRGWLRCGFSVPVTLLIPPSRGRFIARGPCVWCRLLHWGRVCVVDRGFSVDDPPGDFTLTVS